MPRDTPELYEFRRSPDPPEAHAAVYLRQVPFGGERQLIYKLPHIGKPTPKKTDVGFYDISIVPEGIIKNN